MMMIPAEGDDQHHDETSISLSSLDDLKYRNVEEIDGKEEAADEQYDDDTVVSILGEVVCAHQLIKDDSISNDNNDDDNNDNDVTMNPFCIVSFRKKEIHRTTKSAQPGKNPYWTIGSGSLFIIQATVRDLALDGSLEVSLWTKQKNTLLLSTIDTIFLGRACISSETILANCHEQPVVVKLYDHVVDTGLGSRGSLTLHFRMATPADALYVMGQRSSAPRLSPWPLMKQNSSGSVISGASAAADGPVSSPSSPGALGTLYDAIQGPSNTIMSLQASCSNSKKTPPYLLLEQQAQQEQENAAEPSAKAHIPTEVDDAQAAGTSFVNALSSAFKSKSFFDKKAGQQKVLVKPHPDPHRVGETTYLSAREIKVETMTKPSQQWIEAGSGRLGKLYVEVLSCHNLPNMDTGETVGNLTDAFVCAVFEDAMVQTAVVDDELSPHWLPWTQRAFIFGIMHPASMLYLGCFDFDFGISEHEKIGRVAVNISNLQRDTDYTLTYNLYPSSNVTERTANGTLTIRLRVEYHDEKQALMEALKERPVFHVNVKREKTLKVVHYTCFGEYGDENEEKFDFTVTRSYINEILGYKQALTYCFGDVIRSLVFWRGQVKILGIMLPLHSFLFFCAWSTLVEHPSKFPAFMILSVAWVMIALGTKRQQHPSPWERGQSFWHYVEVLRTGRSHLRIRRIAANEGAKDTAAYEKQWNDRLARDEDTANRRYQMEQQLNHLGRQEIHTKMNGTMIPIELLDKLARWQGILGRLIRKFRFIKIIVTWEESIVSFWFTACFLVAGLISLLLPWAFILTWLGRGIVWGCLGPHMMIVDAYLHSNSEDDEKLLQQTMKKFKEDRIHARARHQQASKLKDLKCEMFGKYITLVPNFNLNRHFDRPIACSFARLHQQQQQDESESKVKKLPNKYIPGQQFFGVMVPRTQPAALEFEKEQPKLQKTLNAVSQGISRIQETKRQKLEDRLERSMRVSTPDSIGFELLESKSFGRDVGDDKNNVHNAAAAAAAAAIGDDNGSVSSSVDVDEKSKTAVISFFRQSSTRRNNRESLRFGYELLTPPTSSNDAGVQGGVNRSSSWPLVGGADASGTIDENAKEDDESSRHLVRCHSATGFLRDSVQAMAKDMSYDDAEAEQEDNGIEVILRTIEEEEDDATLAAGQSSYGDQNEEGDEDICASQPSDDDNRSMQYHRTRPLGDKEKAENDEVERCGLDRKKQRHAIVRSGISSDKLEDETRDGEEELQCSRRLGCEQDDKNAATTEAASRTKSEELDTPAADSLLEMKSNGNDSSLVTVVLYRQA